MSWFLFVYPEGQHPLQLAEVLSSHLSLVELSDESECDSMSRFNLFLSNFPFCLKQSSLQISVQQLKDQICFFFLSRG